MEFNPADVKEVCGEQDELFKKYEYFLLGREVDKNPQLCWCPLPDCMGFGKRKGREVVEEMLSCLECGH